MPYPLLGSALVSMIMYSKGSQSRSHREDMREDHAEGEDLYSWCTSVHLPEKAKNYDRVLTYFPFSRAFFMLKNRQQTSSKDRPNQAVDGEVLLSTLHHHNNTYLQQLLARMQQSHRRTVLDAINMLPV